jgi:hypothetical protein
MTSVARLLRSIAEIECGQIESTRVVLEPLLQAISDFLDDHKGLITAIQGASEAYASCQRPAA